MEAETSFKKISSKTEITREALDKFTRHISDILFQPLNEICLNLHKTMCYLRKNGSLPSEYVTMIRDNQVKLIPEKDFNKFTELCLYLDLYRES